MKETGEDGRGVVSGDVLNDLAYCATGWHWMEYSIYYWIYYWICWIYSNYWITPAVNAYIVTHSTTTPGVYSLLDWLKY